MPYNALWTFVDGSAMPSLTEQNDFDSARKRNSARIEVRSEPEQKKRFEQAAALEGQTLSEFLIRSAEERATRVFSDHGVMTLQAAARERFVAMVSDPPKPNDRLRAAFRRHDEEVESR